MSNFTRALDVAARPKAGVPAQIPQRPGDERRYAGDAPRTSVQSSMDGVRGESRGCR
jgi:hypothetical protein